MNMSLMFPTVPDVGLQLMLENTHLNLHLMFTSWSSKLLNKKDPIPLMQGVQIPPRTTKEGVER